MNEFTRKEDSARFTSRIDKKGRALVSADIRKLLKLRYGSVILVEVNGSSFSARIDERGRFSVPTRIRNGWDSVAVNIRACGAREAGANPAPGPIFRRCKK